MRLRIVQQNLNAYEGNYQDSILKFEEYRQKTQNPQLKVNIVLTMLGSQENDIQAYLLTGRIIQDPCGINKQFFQRKQSFYDMQRFMGQPTNYLMKFSKLLQSLDKNEMKQRLQNIFCFLNQFEKQRIKCNKKCCCNEYQDISTIYTYNYDMKDDDLEYIIKTPQILYDTSLNNNNFQQNMQYYNEQQQKQNIQQQPQIDDVQRFNDEIQKPKQIYQNYKIPEKLRKIFTELIQMNQESNITPHPWSDESHSLTNLLIKYQEKQQPCMLTQPLSRLIFFGQLIDYQQNDIKFKCDFNKMQNFEIRNSNGFAPLPLPENIEQPMLTYSYLLLLLNQRIQWANKIAEIIVSIEKMSRCTCGQCLTLINSLQDINLLTSQLSQQMTTVQCTKTFVDSLIILLPPPQLPSLELIYITLQTNPIIVEYLLGLKRLPDVGFMRSLAYTIQNTRQINSQRLMVGQQATIIQKQVAEAINYVSEAGHYWQADDLYCDIYKTAMISKIARSDAGICNQQIEYDQWFMAFKQQFQGIEEVIKYPCLDFLYQSYKSFIDYQLFYWLKSQYNFHQTYFSQLQEYFNKVQQSQQDKIKTPQQQLFNSQNDDFLGNQFMDLKIQQNIQDIPTFVTPFDIDGQILSLQTNDTLKSSIASFSYEKRYRQDLQGSHETYTFQTMNYEQVYLQLLSSLTDQLPNLNIGYIISVLGEQSNDSKTNNDLYTIVMQQVQKILPNFQQNIQNKTNRKGKTKQKGQQSQQQQTNTVQRQFNENNIKMGQLIMDDVEIINDFICKYTYSSFQFINIQMAEQFNYRLNKILQFINQYSHQQIEYISNPILKSAQEDTLIAQYDSVSNIMQFRYLLGSFYAVNDFDINKIINSKIFRELVKETVTTQQSQILSEILSFLSGIQISTEQMLMFIQQNEQCGTPAQYVRKIMLDESSFYGQRNLYNQDFIDGQQIDCAEIGFNRYNSLISFKDQITLDYRLWCNKTIIPCYEQELLQSKYELLKQQIGQFLNIDLAIQLLKDNNIVDDTILKQPNILYESVLNNDNNTLYYLILTHDFTEQQILQAVNFAFYALNYQALELLLGLQPLIFSYDINIDYLQQVFKRQLTLPEVDQTIQSQVQYDQYKRLHSLILNSAMCVGVKTQDTQQQMKMYRLPQFYDHQKQYQQVQQLKSEKQKYQLNYIQLKNEYDQIAERINNLTVNNITQKETAILDQKIDQIKKDKEETEKQISQLQNLIDQHEKHYLFKSQQQMQKFFQEQQKVRQKIKNSYSIQFTLIFQSIMNQFKYCSREKPCLQCRIRKQSVGQYNKHILISERCQQQESAYNQCIYYNRTFQTQISRENCAKFIEIAMDRRMNELLQVYKYEKPLQTDFVILTSYQSQQKNELTDLFTMCINSGLYQSDQQINFINCSTTLTIAAQVCSNYIQYYQQLSKIEISSVQILQYVNFTDGFGYTAMHHSICSFIRAALMFLEKGSEQKDQIINVSQTYEARIVNIAYNCLMTLMDIDQTSININNLDGINIKDRLLGFLIQKKFISTNSSELQQLINIVYNGKDNNEKQQTENEPILTELIFQLFLCLSDNQIKVMSQTKSDQKYKESLKKLTLAQIYRQQQKMNQRKQKIIQVLQGIQGQQQKLYQSILNQVQQNKIKFTWTVLMDRQQEKNNQLDEYTNRQAFIMYKLASIIRQISDNEKIAQQFIGYVKEHKVSQQLLNILVPDQNNWLGYSFKEIEKPKRAKHQIFEQPTVLGQYKVFPFFTYIDQDINEVQQQQKGQKQLFQDSLRFIKEDKNAFSYGDHEFYKTQQTKEQIQYNNYIKRFDGLQFNQLTPRFFNQKQQINNIKKDILLQNYLSNLYILEKSRTNITLAYRISYQINHQFQQTEQKISLTKLLSETQLLPRFEINIVQNQIRQLDSKNVYLIPRHGLYGNTDDLIEIRKMLLRFINRFKHNIDYWSLNYQQLLDFFKLGKIIDLEMQNLPIISSMVNSDLQTACITNHLHYITRKQLYNLNEADILQYYCCDTDQDVIELKNLAIQEQQYYPQIKFEQKNQQYIGFTKVKN